MTRESPSDASQGLDVLVEDLIVTESFLIKGRVDGKFSRLVKTLEDDRRDFLVVNGATMIDLLHGEVIRTPRVHVNMRAVLFAHELVDAGSDYFQKRLSAESGADRVRVRVFFHGPVNLEVAGRIRPRAYEAGLKERSFFVMDECEVRGLNLEETPELEILAKLPYAIVHAPRVSYLYDFS
ncbi:MAG TPA: hypothetical protein PKE00_17135 [Planctomycetota bacterium]|nr:hypothetical protein [Planctomycetota bacterium]